MNKQEAKESACLCAIRLGFGLIRRDLEVHAIYTNGVSEVISRSGDYDRLWHDAYKVLKGRVPPRYLKEYVDPYQMPDTINSQTNSSKS